MSSNASLLYLFSVGFTVFAALMVIVPTLLRRRPVFSVWNLFWSGAVMFNGLSGIEAASAKFIVTLGAKDYQRYYIGTVIFYSAVVLAYFVFKSPRRLAGRTLMRWPSATPGSLLVVSVLMIGLGALPFAPIQIPFVSQVILQLGLHAPIAALAFAMLAWWRDKTNSVAIVILLAAAVFAPVAILGTGISRRYLLSALLTLPIVAEWLYLRHKSLTFRLVTLAAIGAMTLPILMGHTLIRRSLLTDQSGSTVERSVRLLQKLPEAILRGGSSKGLTGQSSVEVGLTAINVCRTAPEKIEPVPFFTILYMIQNPIPRSVWPERAFGPKLESVGLALPRNLGVWRTGYVNWGVNVIGQGYYDGGIHIHLIYGLVVGFLLRYAEEVMIRKPGNPFILSIFIVTSSQILAWTRGSIEIFSYQIIAGALVVLLVAAVMRLLFGTGHVDPRTDHLDDPAAAEQAATAWVWASQLNWRR